MDPDGPSDPDGDAAPDRAAVRDRTGALRWETTGSAIDYSCPGFDVRRDEVTLPDGTDTSFHYVEEPPGVVVLPFTPDGDVVVIEEWRQAVGRINRSLPAGTADESDDDLAATARRELREETGYRAAGIDPEPFLSAEPANGLLGTERHFFRAWGCEPDSAQSLDENESILVDVVPYEALLSAALDNELRDERAITALLHHELAAGPNANGPPDG